MGCWCGNLWIVVQCVVMTVVDDCVGFKEVMGLEPKDQAYTTKALLTSAGLRPMVCFLARGIGSWGILLKANDCSSRVSVLLLLVSNCLGSLCVSLWSCPLPFYTFCICTPHPHSQPMCGGMGHHPQASLFTCSNIMWSTLRYGPM